MNYLSIGLLATPTKDGVVKFSRLLVAFFIVVMMFHPTTKEISRAALSDGFFQVSSFVAATLLVYQLVSQIWQNSRLVKDKKLGSFQEIVIASCLGALPGCGGAIIVATQFTQGRASFAALVAVLCSTMGDAAFLLLAKLPADGFIVIALGIATGIVSGLFTAKFNPYSSAQNQQIDQQQKIHKPAGFTALLLNLSSVFWSLLLIPATIVAVTLAFQLDVSQTLGLSESSQLTMGSACALTIVFFWLMNDQSAENIESSNLLVTAIKRTSIITNSVSVWVFLSFLLFEVMVLYLGSEAINSYLKQTTSAPLLAAMVGLLPGCGPQIMVTNLYLQNLIPFSGQLANAISNDGDALFPAIAIAPKAALLATAYTLVPALAVGYGYFFLFES